LCGNNRGSYRAIIYNNSNDNYSKGGAKMPRTQGAKNKPKSKEFHLNALKELGVKIIEKGGSISVNTPAKEAAKEIKKLQFSIKKPANETAGKPAEPVKKDDDILYCGHCRAILKSKVTSCPSCGWGLKWD
jgi:hypothetical protein